MLSPGDRSAIQQQQQQLLDENQRQRDALERSAPLTVIPSPEMSAGTEGPCFTVSRIVVSGATRLTSAETDRLVAPWVNQCLNITGLTAVTDAVTDGYIRRGYITSRAFLTEQDLSGGVLHITVSMAIPWWITRIHGVTTSAPLITGAGGGVPRETCRLTGWDCRMSCSVTGT